MTDRILLYRPGFLGDVVMSLPAVRLVRQYNPGAHITYATNPPCGALLQECPWVDEVRKAGTYRLAEFDKICHFSHEQYWDVRKYWGELHIMNAQAAGLLPEKFDDQVNLQPMMWLAAELPQIVGSPCVVIHVHSTNGKNWRLWGLDKWASLVDRIVTETGWGVEQIGTESAPLIRGTVDLREQSVMQDIWSVATATFCVCIESFIAHVAHAQKLYLSEEIKGAVPTVLLNGPIAPVCVVPPGARCVVVSNYDGCRRGGPCGHSHGSQKCESKNACMRDLTVEQAWAGVEKVLDGIYT